VGLKDYLHIIRVRKWLIIIAVLVVTATAVVASMLQPNVYRGEATVLVAEQNTGAALAGAAGNILNELSGQSANEMATQVQLMQLRPLAETVIRELSLRTTPDKLMQRVTVTNIGQTDLVTVSVTDSTPQRAAATANALAGAYVDWSRDQMRASITNAADEIDARLTDAQSQILDLGKKMNGGNTTDLQTQLQDAVSQQQRLVGTLVQLNIDAQNETSSAQLASTNADISSTEQQLADVKAKILSLGSQLASASSKNNNTESLAELQIATGLYSNLAQTYETLEVSQQLETGSGSVVAKAAIDPVPVSPKPVRNGALGLAVGLVFGLGMALLFEYLDNTIKSTAEVEKLYGAPVLGNIPREQFEKGQLRRLTIVERPGSYAAETYRGLRNSIGYINFEHNVKTVLVTSAAPDEGKSTVSANLAASLAMAGSKVVLLNCDFRRPTTHQFFAVDPLMGLSDVLADRVPLEAALQHTDDENLVVLASGRVPPNPSELLGSQKMVTLIETLKADYDWIIVDSPPLLAVADTAASARWVDGVLVVTRAGVSTHPAAVSARDMLDKVGARILGVVVWGLDESGGGHYGSYGGGHYGGYHYSAYHSDTDPDGSMGSSRHAAPGARARGTRGAGRRRASRSAVSEDGEAEGPASWLTGWRLGLVVFIVLVVVLVATVLLLNGWLGWFTL
jgi:capsular exopolysaccharide synthesis family protein